MVGENASARRRLTVKTSLMKKLDLEVTVPTDGTTTSEDGLQLR